MRFSRIPVAIVWTVVVLVAAAVTVVFLPITLPLQLFVDGGRRSR